jgi:hypothetical protein
VAHKGVAVARIRIVDLSRDMKISEKELYEIWGGFTCIRFYGSGPEITGHAFYEVIPPTFDQQYISEMGEVHAADFDDSSKSQREFTKAILWP